MGQTLRKLQIATPVSVAQPETRSLADAGSGCGQCLRSRTVASTILGETASYELAQSCSRPLYAGRSSMKERSSVEPSLAAPNCDTVRSPFRDCNATRALNAAPWYPRFDMFSSPRRSAERRSSLSLLCDLHKVALPMSDNALLRCCVIQHGGPKHWWIARYE